MKTTLLTVGRTRPPFAEADAHYRKLLVALPAGRGGRGPRRARPAAQAAGRAAGWSPSTPAGARWTRSSGAAGSSERRLEARDLCLLIGGPTACRRGARRGRRADLARAADDGAPARPRGRPRAALPGLEDPRRRALPPLTVRLGDARDDGRLDRRAARRRRAGGRLGQRGRPARRPSPRWSARRSPSSATTAPTRRCCSPRPLGEQPARRRRAPRAPS